MTSVVLSLGSSSFLINLSVMFMQTKCTIKYKKRFTGPLGGLLYEKVRDAFRKIWAVISSMNLEALTSV